MDVAPVNNKSDGLWLWQGLEGGTSGRQKEFWDRARHGKSSTESCEEKDTWYLSTGNQTCGRMYNGIYGLL